ncbi:hypothetical protein [Chitinophaga sp. Ak27]|uniref:hypothetical protein n=1 Tax=Chitinophaga sp. Ak27 TaxID=2726116 RepID=UPI00145C709F|nr:hypothetical protein [Chitinophaga sp. Ak27]NLU95714.1 hypothetical protein [Chitinophaga sp. Ak27]
MVKRIAAYILLFIFFLHNTGFDQLLKIPMLVVHYKEHQQRNHQLSITDFLCIHYLLPDDGDNDADRDMQLPYKTIDVNLLHHAFVPLAKAITVNRQPQQTPIAMNYPILRDYHLPEPALSSLFRPPRTEAFSNS